MVSGSSFTVGTKRTRQWGCASSSPSGVRRFRPEDVEAVRKQMFSGFAPMHADEDIVPVRAHSVD